MRGRQSHQRNKYFFSWTACASSRTPPSTSDRSIALNSGSIGTSPHRFRYAFQKRSDTTGQWAASSKRLKRLLRDGLRLRKRPDFTPDRYRSRVDLIDGRLAAPAAATYDDPHAARLAKRLGRFRDYYFTFPEEPGVPPDDNHAERQIRPAVVRREAILCDRSTDGAEVQAVLMSVFRTLRLPVPATAEHPERVDYEYERAGVANVFMFAEPLAGWREATVRATKTKVDWAVEVARLLEGRYADCPYVTLVCDNLNTHTAGAFYAAFEPEPARKLVARTRFCHTPKHGGWLNIAPSASGAR